MYQKRQWKTTEENGEAREHNQSRKNVREENARTGSPEVCLTLE